MSTPSPSSKQPTGQTEQQTEQQTLADNEEMDDDDPTPAKSKGRKSTVAEWNYSFQALIKFVLQNKDWPNQESEPSLYTWMVKQRKNHYVFTRRNRSKKPTIKSQKAIDRFKQLEDIGFPFSGTGHTLSVQSKPNLELFSRAQQSCATVTGDDDEDEDEEDEDVDMDDDEDDEDWEGDGGKNEEKDRNDKTKKKKVPPSSSWHDQFNDLVRYIKQYKAWPMHKTNLKLHRWICQQRYTFRRTETFTDQSTERYNLLKQLGFPFDGVVGRGAFDGEPNLSSPLLSSSARTRSTTSLKDNSRPSVRPPPSNRSSPTVEQTSRKEQQLSSNKKSTNEMRLSSATEQEKSTSKRKHSLVHNLLSSQQQSLTSVIATNDKSNNGGGQGVDSSLSTASRPRTVRDVADEASAAISANHKRQRTHHDNNLSSRASDHVMSLPVQQSSPMLVDPAMWWSVSAHNNDPANYNNATRLLHHCMCRYNWDRPLAIRILRAYRQFLELKVVMKDNHENISRNNNKNGRGKLVPSRLVNQMWQRHVLDNAHYRKDCHVICKGQEIYYHDQDEYYGSVGLGRNNNNKERQEKTLVALEARFGSDEVDMEIWNFEESNRICARQAEEDEPQESGTQVSTDDSTTSQEESDGGTDMKAANNNNDDNMNDSNPPIADNDNKKPECVGVTIEPMNETLPSKQQDQQQPKETEAAAAAAPPPPPTTTTNRSKSASDSSKSAIVLSVIDKHNGEVICFRILETKKLSKIFAVYTQRKRMENDEQKSQEWQFGLKDKDGNLTVIDPNATSEALGLKEGDEIVAWQKGK